MPEEPRDIQWATSSELVLTALAGPGLAEFELEPEQLIGRALADGPPESSLGLFDLAQHQRALEGTSARFDHTVGGRKFQVRIHAFRGPDGRALGCLATAFDLAPRIALQNVLRRKNVSLTRVQEIAQAGSWEWNLVTGNVAWSSTLYRLFGIDPACPLSFDELLGFIHPDDRDRARRVASQARRAGNIQAPSRFRLLRADGAVREIWVDGRPTELADGTPGWVGFVQDITRIRQTEERLHANEAVIRELKEIATSGEQPLETRIRRALQLGCERFGLEFGLLNRYDAKTSQVHIEFAVTPSDMAIEPGMSLPINTSPCQLIIKTREPQCIMDLRVSPWGETPGVANLELASYIGAPVYLDDELYGTLCFHSRQPLPCEPTNADMHLLQLMTAFVGKELERARAASNLKLSRARSDELARNMPSMIYRFVLETSGRMSMSYVSDGLREIFGLEPEAVTRDVDVLLSMIHADDFEGWKRSVERSAETLQPWRWEGRFVLRTTIH